MSPTLRRPKPRDVPSPPAPVATLSGAATERRRTFAGATPVLLLRAAHLRQALVTAAGLAVAAAMSGRTGREVGLVLATVLVGQAILGWHNDLVDRQRDERRPPGRKPIADGSLDPGTAWFALSCGVLLVVPLAVSHGITAGCAYLASLGAGLLGNAVLRRGLLSWLPWAAAYALYPAFLSYGGPPAGAAGGTGSPPEVAMVAIAALLGIGVHVLCALPGLVADHEDGYRHLPLRLALRTGAPRLLVLASAWTVLAVAGLLVVGSTVGLSR